MRTWLRRLDALQKRMDERAALQLQGLKLQEEMRLARERVRQGTSPEWETERAAFHAWETEQAFGPMPEDLADALRECRHRRATFARECRGPQP